MGSKLTTGPKASVKRETRNKRKRERDVGKTVALTRAYVTPEILLLRRSPTPGVLIISRSTRVSWW